MHQALEVSIKNNELIIRLPVSTLAWAAEHGETFFRIRQEYGSPAISVSDESVFAKSVLHALQVEEEDGSTLVTRMFDAAIDYVIEQGEDGIDYPGDEELKEVE